MSTTDCIIGLFYRVGLTIGHLPKQPQTRLHPSEIVTLALVFALTGGTGRAFYRLKVCKRGSWNVRMVVETVLSMLTTVCRIKKLSHRTWPSLAARLGYTLALFNILVQWDGLPVDADGNVHLSIAQFSL